MAFEGIYVSPQSSQMATPCQATGDFTRWKMTQTRESENYINQSVGELLCSLAKKQWKYIIPVGNTWLDSTLAEATDRSTINPRSYFLNTAEIVSNLPPTQRTGYNLGKT